MTPAELIEMWATACGIAGAFLLAHKGPRAGWGFVAYLASNVGWILFALQHGHGGLLVQQLVFLAASLYGVWIWLVVPWLDRLLDDVLPLQ